MREHASNLARKILASVEGRILQKVLKFSSKLQSKP
jgi:hypothetical protein